MGSGKAPLFPQIVVRRMEVIGASSLAVFKLVLGAFDCGRGRPQRIQNVGVRLTWSGRLDSNQRPPAPKAGALPLRHAPTLADRSSNPVPERRTRLAPARNAGRIALDQASER
jgi:hypothetical protein